MLTKAVCCAFSFDKKANKTNLGLVLGNATSASFSQERKAKEINRNNILFMT
jgi:hypothetical protein